MNLLKRRRHFLLNEFLAFVNVVYLVREWLAWMDEDYEVSFECRIDIGSSNAPRMKTMSPICDEKEWAAYVGVVIKLEIHKIGLVTRMVTRNDVCDESSRSPTLLEAVDMPHVKCGVMLTQSLEETQGDTDPEEPHSLVVMKPC
jgi:hypothetical protein